MNAQAADGIALPAYAALQRFTLVYNDIFSPSRWRRFRRSLPIPGFFEAIPFDQHTRTLSEVRANISTLQSRSRAALAGETPGTDSYAFLTIFGEYANALLNAVGLLERVCKGLAQTAGGRPGLSMHEYKELTAALERAGVAYSKLGYQLNTAYRRVKGG